MATTATAGRTTSTSGATMASAGQIIPRRDADWADPGARALAIYLDGSDDPDRADDGTPLLDDDFLVLVNSWWEPLGFALPATRPGAQWHAEIDSYDPAAPVEVSRRAAKAVTSLDKPLRRKILAAIDALSGDPRPAGGKKLAGQETWRIRVGDYRIIYEIHDQVLLVIVVDIGHRREIYR